MPTGPDVDSIAMARANPTQWAQLFALPEHPALPLQARLRLAIVQAVMDNRLSPGAALPSSRELARLLHLGRNTVTAAYEQLVDEQFLEARPRSGVFVARHERPTIVMRRAKIRAVLRDK